MMHSGTPETGQKSRFFNFSQRLKGIFARGFHHNALFLLLKSKMRALEPALSEQASLWVFLVNALSLLENAKNHKFFALYQPQAA